MVIVTPQIVRPIPAGQQIPMPNFPVPFLPPNTAKEMTTPGQNVTGPVPVTPPTQSMPVESFIKSLQETPLVVTSTTSATSGRGFTDVPTGGACACTSGACARAPPP